MVRENVTNWWWGRWCWMSNRVPRWLIIFWETWELGHTLKSISFCLFKYASVGSLCTCPLPWRIQMYVGILETINHYLDSTTNTLGFHPSMERSEETDVQHIFLTLLFLTHNIVEIGSTKSTMVNKYKLCIMYNNASLEMNQWYKASIKYLDLEIPTNHK